MGPKRKASNVNSNVSSFSPAPRKIRIQKKKDLTAQQLLHAETERLKMENRQNWFSRYANSEDPDTIGPDGCQTLFSDLNVSLESPIPFIFGWKMNSTQMGYIKRTEWMHTLTSLNICEEEDLKRALNDWEKSTMEDAASFKQLYLFIFTYVKSTAQKSMDVETAVALWHVILETKYPITTSFIRFIEEAKPVKVINKDQWSSLLDFCKAVPESLEDYDTTSSWPVLFDDYVEWRQKMC